MARTGTEIGGWDICVQNNDLKFDVMEHDGLFSNFARDPFCTVTMPVNQWTLCALTLEYTIGDWEGSLYLKTEDLSTNSKVEFGAEQVFLGGYLSDYFFIGQSGTRPVQVCEIGHWNRVLSDAEIEQLFNFGIGKTYPFN
jgi:hypothetical protein